MSNDNNAEKLLPFSVVAAATKGDAIAMDMILKHYEGYITKLCTRVSKDSAGNSRLYVDEEMRSFLQSQLIARTLTFQIE